MLAIIGRAGLDKNIVLPIHEVVHTRGQVGEHGIYLGLDVEHDLSVRVCTREEIKHLGQR